MKTFISNLVTFILLCLPPVAVYSILALAVGDIYFYGWPMLLRIIYVFLALAYVVFICVGWVTLAKRHKQAREAKEFIANLSNVKYP